MSTVIESAGSDRPRSGASLPNGWTTSCGTGAPAAPSPLGIPRFADHEVFKSSMGCTSRGTRGSLCAWRAEGARFGRSTGLGLGDCGGPAREQRARAGRHGLGGAPPRCPLRGDVRLPSGGSPDDGGSVVHAVRHRRRSDPGGWGARSSSAPRAWPSTTLRGAPGASSPRAFGSTSGHDNGRAGCLPASHPARLHSDQKSAPG